MDGGVLPFITQHIDPTLTRYGERQGLIMLGATDGIMEVLNSPEFSPREF